MKLIDQKIIYFKKGNSDKVYEVDLCQINDSEYVVNFRYGRRGGNLKDGTKTVLPVDEAKAKKVFDDLVQSKVKKGYRESLEDFSSEFEDSEKELDKKESASVPINGLTPKESAIIKRVQEGFSSSSQWTLERAVWKAGELQIKACSDIVVKYLGKSGMLDYSILWSLGRIGNQSVIPKIKEIISKPTSYSDFDNKAIRRIAFSSGITLSTGEDKEFFKSELLGSLSHKYASRLDDTTGKKLSNLLHSQSDDLSKDELLDIEKLYLLDPPGFRKWFMDYLRRVPMKPGYFHFVKHLYKLSEQLLDPEVFGITSMRFENTNHYYSSPAWIWNDSFHVYTPELGYRKVHVDEKKKEDPPVSYSSNTRYYLKKRVWRHLKNLGERKSRHYVRLAARILAEIDEKDAKTPDYNCFYDWQNGYKMTKVWKDKFCHFLAANWILYGKSTRYKLSGSKTSFVCDNGWEPGGEVPNIREELHQELWDKDAQLVLDLIIESKAEIVHQFCVKILKNHTRLLESISSEQLLMLLNSPYECTAELALQGAVLALEKSGDVKIFKALVDSSHERHAQAGLAYLQSHSQLNESPEFIAVALACQNDGIRDQLCSTIKAWTVSNEVYSKALKNLIDWVKQSEDENFRSAIAGQIKTIFSEVDLGTPLEEIDKLLEFPYIEVQEIGAALLVGRGLDASELPDSLIENMINSESLSIRDSALKLMFQFTDKQLTQRSTLIHSLLTHAHEDLRENAKPVFVRLCNADEIAGQKLSDELLGLLIRGRIKKDILNELSNFILKSLLKYLQEIPKERIKKLITVSVPSANKVGGELLGSLNSEDFSNFELSQMLTSPTATIREHTRRILSENQERFRNEPISFVPALDTEWDDSREYVFNLFQEQSDCLDCETLIAVCDSTDNMVQKFGRELLMRNFEKEDGLNYIIKLSEHPSQNIQIFVSSFLESEITGKPEEAKKLLPFIKSCLIKVNKGRVIKHRLLSFLDKETVNNEEMAKVFYPLLYELSGANSVELKAAAIKSVALISKIWPAIIAEEVTHGV